MLMLTYFEYLRFVYARLCTDMAHIAARHRVTGERRPRHGPENNGFKTS